ncbi:MAG: mandelate racemase/muconate lactonizing enzyme family protein [candidate division NC10 bacterium]|nr:mandelate racemase/muconate lactonizing enzyme family protein [candidate division NC10 bacterium]
MKITKVEPILLSVPMPEEYIVRWSGGEMAVVHVVLVRVHTDEGITGLGDTYAGGFFYPSAAKGLLEHFEALLLGEDPFNVEGMYQKLWWKSQFWGRVGAAVNAISAIENALWDVKGKALGLPVWQLLGGLAHPKLLIYASGGLEKPKERTRAEMEGYVKDTFKAVKIRVSTDVKEAVEKVKFCREVLGPDVQLMVDAVMGSHPEPWSAKEAIQFARAIEPYDISWLEEPCWAADIEGYAEVRRATMIPISGGETSATIHEFKGFFEKGALDIVQPDACLSGGLLECKRVATLAAAYGVRVAPHAWGSAATVLANVHWAFTTPNVFIHEYPTWGFPLRDELLVEPLEIKDGYLYPPKGPGLGVELRKETIERYPFKGGIGADMRKG